VSFDHNADRYLDVGTALRKILQQLDSPNTKVDSIEVTCLANGEATYRYREPRGDYWEGGYIPAS
jgi:hypothetical protein